MIFFEWIDNHLSTQEFLDQCKEKGLRFSLVGRNILRAVTHLDISYQDIINAVGIIGSIKP